MINLRKTLILFFLLTSFSFFASTRTLKSFGAKGNGITDDSVAISIALSACQNGEVVDGEGLLYLFENTVGLTLKQVNLVNCKFVLGKTYSKQGNFIITSNKINLTNISVDGRRNTIVKDVEQWRVFTTENNIKSISPSRPDFFCLYAMDKNAQINVSKFTVKNLHAFSALTVYSLGKVMLTDLHFENLSYKTFHIYHSADDGKTSGGETIVTNAYAKNVGILPVRLLIDGKNYNRNNVQMMPQASFNFIVSHGKYTAHNLNVLNYGSTAVTADRNENFIGDDITITNNSAFTFSNNPSGGMWFEKCDNATIGNLKIKITSRDKRDLGFDSSAMHIFSAGGNVSIDNLTIESGNLASLNKGLRGSLVGKCNILIKNFKLSGKYKTAGAQFALLDNSILSTIKIDVLNLDSPSVEFYGMQNVVIGDVIGKTGNEHLSFKLPSSTSNIINYEVKKSNLKVININKNVKDVKLMNSSKKPLIKIVN